VPFRFLPDVALADVAFEASSPSIAGLFEVSAAALTEVMVDRRSVSARTRRSLHLGAEDADRLLYDFLTELIVIKDVDLLVFKEVKVKVGKDGRSLDATLRGEKIDRKKHRLRNDVKAVTMHMFGIKREGRSWKVTVVLDI
jgi:SHS2 domain-containing protein